MMTSSYHQYSHVRRFILRSSLYQMINSTAFTPEIYNHLKMIKPININRYAKSN